MLPLVLDAARLPLALVGGGPATSKRLELLDDAGATQLEVFAPGADDALADRAGTRLRRIWPTAGALSGKAVVFVADLDDQRAGDIHRLARSVGALVNVEDKKPYCDLHVPAIVRRGDLLLTVSTAGRSPRLAVRLRRALAALFGPEWAGRLDKVARARELWRAAGLPLVDLAARTDALIARQGWLEGLAESGCAPSPPPDAEAERPREPMAIERV